MCGNKLCAHLEIQQSLVTDRGENEQKCHIFLFHAAWKTRTRYEPTEMNSRVTGELKIQLNLDRSMNQEVKRLSQETGQISAEIKYLAW